MRSNIYVISLGIANARDIVSLTGPSLGWEGLLSE